MTTVTTTPLTADELSAVFTPDEVKFLLEVINGRQSAKLPLPLTLHGWRKLLNRAKKRRRKHQSYRRRREKAKALGEQLLCQAMQKVKRRNA